MHPDDKGNDKDKKWGTIYLDASRESTVEKLDAMQAASRREQVQQRTEQEYLEKVRAKATERAKEILGEVYTERQHILDEARQEAEGQRREAEAQYGLAAQEREEAQKIREAAQEELRQAEAIREAAQGEGFNAGLEQAQQELEEFRGAMGASVAGVLGAIHRQCGTIYEGWRQEMVELLRVCVEKGTGLVLDEQYPLVLEHLVMEAVRQLDDRRCITLRVHPDDEAAVADMFAAARERLPNIGQWIVTGDPALQLGGLIAESQSGTVDSRLELHQQLVENILQHLVLPASSLESEADRAVAEAVRQEAAKIALLAPPPPPPAEEALPEDTEQPQGWDAAEEGIPPPPDAALSTEDAAAAPPQEMSGAALPAEGLPAEELHTEELCPEVFHTEELPVEAILHQAEREQAEHEQAEHEQAEHEHPQPPAVQTVPHDSPTPEMLSGMEDNPASAAPPHPTRDELEHELFDLLPAAPPSPQDEILAQGGFLDSPSDKANASPQKEEYRP